jgi:hypothetical protein
MSTPFRKLADQLATDMTYLNELLIRRDRYGQDGLDEQIGLLQQSIDVKRPIAEGQPRESLATMERGVFYV